MFAVEFYALTYTRTHTHTTLTHVATHITYTLPLV
jgi:hypothetical protein